MTQKVTASIVKSPSAGVFTDLSIGHFFRFADDPESRVYQRMGPITIADVSYGMDLFNLSDIKYNGSSRVLLAKEVEVKVQF